MIETFKIVRYCNNSKWHGTVATVLHWRLRVQTPPITNTVLMQSHYCDGAKNRPFLSWKFTQLNHRKYTLTRGKLEFQQCPFTTIYSIFLYPSVYEQGIDGLWKPLNGYAITENYRKIIFKLRSHALKFK